MTLPGFAPTFVSERHTIPALGTYTVRYRFKPDQIFIMSPAWSVVTGINISLVGMQGGGAVPLLAQGPVILPGVSQNQEILITSLESVNVDLLIIAQAGYPPVTVTTPTNLAVASTIAALAVHKQTGAGSITFTIAHPGGPLLILVGSSNTGGATGAHTSISVGGSAAVKIAESFTNPNSRSRVTAWYINTGSMSGNLSVVLTAGGTHTGLLAYCLSFQAGVVSGNTAIISGETASTRNLPLVLQSAAAWTGYVIAADRSGALSEGTGAVLLVNETINTIPVAIYRVTGTAPQTYTFSLTNSGNGISAAAVEIY